MLALANTVDAGRVLATTKRANGFVVLGLARVAEGSVRDTRAAWSTGVVRGLASLDALSRSGRRRKSHVTLKACTGVGSRFKRRKVFAKTFAGSLTAFESVVFVQEHVEQGHNYVGG